MAALEARIAASLSATVDPAVSAFAERLAQEAGADAALFYGSNLRTGELEGVLDFYLLLPGPQQEKIWPRVSYHEWECDGTMLRAKVARMAMETFARAAAGKSRDTTIWTRFVQPSALVWARNVQARKAVATALAAAAMTAARYAAALGPVQGPENAFWKALFQQTYKAEFRIEKPGREDSILTLNAAHFDGLAPAAWYASGIAYREVPGGYAIDWPQGAQAGVLREWRARRRWGKPLNITRLIKATTTFEGAARYAAWKVERHTGMPVEVTPWRERHPILAAPSVLFNLWRSRRKM